MTQIVRWAVGLSDGSNAYEGKNEYQVKDNELSPWNRLLKHVSDQGLTITSLSLYTDANQRWNLPSIGKNPKFKAFDDAPNPVVYNFFRKYGQDILNGKEEPPTLFNVIEARYDDKVLQTWVSEDGKASWSLIL